jgi:hypothetical protein
LFVPPPRTGRIDPGPLRAAGGAVTVVTRSDGRRAMKTRSIMAATFTAFAAAACGASSKSTASTLDIRNDGDAPVVVQVHGEKIELGPGGHVEGVVYEKGDTLSAAGSKGAGARLRLDKGPVYVLLTATKDGNVGIANSSRPITVTEKK